MDSRECKRGNLRTLQEYALTTIILYIRCELFFFRIHQRPYQQAPQQRKEVETLDRYFR